MTNDDLMVYVACFKAEAQIKSSIYDGADLPTPGSERWTSGDLRSQLCSIIQGFLPPDEALITKYVAYRKSADAKIRLTAEVAITHGTRCAYANRDLGPCSDDLDLDRIVPGSRGGEYTIQNCQIACSKHNRQRQDLPIEEYIRTGGSPLFDNKEAR